MNLRAYQSGDLDSVIQLWWDSWHSSSSYNHPKPIKDWELRWRTIENTHSIVVLEQVSEVIAFAAVNEDAQVLSQLFVKPSYKRRGLGKKLLVWVAQECPSGFRLKTAMDNKEAQAFYRALGMLESGRSINDFNDREEIGFQASATVAAKLRASS